mgnify:CR=1 FL=1
MMKLFTEDREQVILAKPITNEKGVKGEGGEGTVYLLSPASDIPNCNQYVAKIYKNVYNLPEWHESKLKRLVQIGRNPDYELKGICFPEHVLYRKYGKKYQCVYLQVISFVIIKPTLLNILSLGLCTSHIYAK